MAFVTAPRKDRLDIPREIDGRFTLRIEPGAYLMLYARVDGGSYVVRHVDVPWNGFTESKKVADMAESFEINCAPHNYYSHLSTLHSMHLCAAIPNVRICEIDIDDVPWKDDLITERMEFDSGEVLIPDRPGWGADLNEEIAKAHVWEPGRRRGDRSSPTGRT